MQKVSAALLLLLAATAAAQRSSKQVIPAAASTATEPAKGKPVIMDFQQLGECTKDSGLSPHLEYCATQSSLTKPGEAHWYRFNVLQEESALTLHFLLRTQNGRVRMGLWFPGQAMDTEPSVAAEILLGSSFAQEQYITIPAQQLFHSPGIYMLQIMNEYGAPQYSLRADLTPATTLLADEDRKLVGQIVKDCCPESYGMVCHMLKQATTADSMDSDLCHQGPVQCDKEGHITDLVLQGANSGADLTCSKFSTAFAALPKLVRLDLAGANLGADLPTIGKALAPAKQLRWLVLRTAGVVGDLSCHIILPSLHLLSLTRNGLTGKIPECFTQPKNLLHLYLSDNALTGPLPDFSADSSLELLFARDQHDVNGKPCLGGTLPASLGSAAKLQHLQLSNSGLTGTIGELPANMKYFNMSSNHLEGPLPALPTSMVSLDFSSNLIGGSLPGDMSSYTNLVDIQAFNNQLQGPLPARLPPNLVQLAVSGNALTGTVPALPRGMKYISVAENNLEGKLPDGPGAAGIWFADLSSNKFTGKIPAAFMQSAELVYLNVSRNQLQGVEAIDSLSTPSLVTLDASHNSIAGEVVPEFAQQPNLAYLSLASNRFTGNLKAFAAMLKPDTRVGAVFDVSSNQLTGELPSGLQFLAALNTAPTSFPSWNDLTTTGYPVKVFDVSDNSFSGSLPNFLYSALVGLVSQHCSDTPGVCNIYIALNGGDNKLTCPDKPQTAADSLLPEDYTLLAKQNIGCLAKDGLTYEISSVLQGKPVQLKVAEKPARPTAQPRREDQQASAGGYNGYDAAAAVPGDAVEEPPRRVRVQQASSSSQHGHTTLPAAAIAGIAAGAVALVVLVAALGYVVVYRRWYTVRAARSFRKFDEGPLAAASGAAVNSSAPAASLPTLGAPEPAATTSGALGGDDRV